MKLESNPQLNLYLFENSVVLDSEIAVLLWSSSIVWVKTRAETLTGIPQFRYLAFKILNSMLVQVQKKNWHWLNLPEIMIF